MINVLCYGDSNTWGYVPVKKGRYTEKERWPRLMADLLGEEFHVIEEGLNGRTTAFTDYLEPYRNSLDYIAPCILTHAPLDLVIIMLGTNDTKGRYCVTSKEITDGMENLIKKLRFFYPSDKFPMPKILIAAPGPLIPGVDDPAFNEDSARKAKELPARYEALAEDMDCLFFNAQTVISESDLGGDGLHLLPDGHKKLAEAFAKAVKEACK